MVKIIDAKAAKELVAEGKRREIQKEKIRLATLEAEASRKKLRARLKRKLAIDSKRIATAICRAAIEGKTEVFSTINFYNEIGRKLSDDGFRLDNLWHIGRDESTRISWAHFKGVDIYKNPSIKNEEKSKQLIKASKMYWLSQSDGQGFISALSNAIRDCADKGEEKIELIVTEVKEQAQTRCLAPIYSAQSHVFHGGQEISSPPLGPTEICEMLMFLGYSISLEGDGEIVSEYRISANW